MDVVRSDGEKRALEEVESAAGAPKRVAAPATATAAATAAAAAAATATASAAAASAAEEEDQAAYDESARLIAEKVQRQQEGLESALLEEEHHDETYRTVDEIQALLEEQRAAMLNSGSRSSRFSLGLSGSSKSVDSDGIAEWFLERSKHIPLRLEYKERSHLRRISAILKSCDYTNLVDGASHKSEARRMMRQGQCVRAVLMGIATSFNFELSRELLEELNFSRHKVTFAKVFEIGRRYKVMNPEKLRSMYGKMVFLLQDARTPAVMRDLEFDLVRPMHTVYSRLEAGGGLDVLRSEWISTATMEILPDGKSRSQIARQIKQKEHAIDLIARKYSRSSDLSPDDIKLCLYSLADNTSYLNSNCKPIDYVIDLLRDWFGAPETADTRWSLAIFGGADGSRLTHTHERQYHYVLQSLTLWREIVHDMFRLWSLAEQDLLDPEAPYKLRQTGQGVHRLQPAPRTSKAMHGILYAVQQRLGHTVQGWVGSSVIHLGDSNVPNALVFIDKYNQVPRILNPIVCCLKYLREQLPKDPALVKLVEHKYGDVEGAARAVLHDFFKRAFDGSGADNFFEAGSCIDGRLTSAWNWCQELPDKDYYFLFKLSGFLSFDGEFK